MMWIMLLQELFGDHVLLSSRYSEVLASDDFAGRDPFAFVKTGNGLPENVERILLYPLNFLL